MQMSLNNLVFQLADKKQFSFRDAKGVYLECTAGRLWLTVEGQPGDFLLSPGERMRIVSNGHALVEGLPSGAFRLRNMATGSICQVNQLGRHEDRIASLPDKVSLALEVLKNIPRTGKSY
jgi:hypothetical protein